MFRVRWRGFVLFSTFYRQRCVMANAVTRHVGNVICIFLAMCRRKKKASLVKGRGTACGGGIGKRGTQSLRRSAPAPFTQGSLLVGRCRKGVISWWLCSGGAFGGSKPPPYRERVCSRYCRTGNLLWEGCYIHPERKVQEAQPPGWGVGARSPHEAAPLRKPFVKTSPHRRLPQHHGAGA